MSRPVTGPEGIERRRGERVAIAAAGGTLSVVGAQLVNLSGYGMLIESPMSLEPQAQLPFRLVIAGEKHDVEAKVVACSATAPRRYEVHLEFVALPAPLRERIAEVVKTALAAVDPRA